MLSKRLGHAEETQLDPTHRMLPITWVKIL